MRTTLGTAAQKRSSQQPQRASAPRHTRRRWTEEEYLNYPGNKLIEFTNGIVEMLPMPSEYHQDVTLNIATALRAFVRTNNVGKVLTAPMPLKVRHLKYREPDVIFKRNEKLSGNPRDTKFWEAADLVVEVVSEGAENRRRDRVVKRAVYAAAKIPEYWIVDLKTSEVTVLKWRGGKYVTHGVFKTGDAISSALLPGLSIPANDVF